MKLRSVLTSLATAVSLGYVAQSHAAIDKRWFEVEVILFSQLGDKSKLNETFSGDGQLPKHRKVIDLLTPYLYPESRSLELQLPRCDDRSYRPSLVDTQAKFPEFLPLLSIEAIDAMPVPQEITERYFLEQIENEQAQSQLNEVEANTAHTGDGLSDELTPENEIKSDSNGIIPNESDIANESISEDVNGAVEQGIDAVEIVLTEEDRTQVAMAMAYFEEKYPELALIEPAENLSELDSLPLPEDTQSNDLSASSYANIAFNYSEISATNRALCLDVVIDDTSTIADYLTASEQQFSQDYDVDNLTGKIDGNEFVYTDHPYLIDADSLQLSDITTQLRRSRNFRPLLHLGWRQSLINRRKPTNEPAIRIFGGDHYYQQYQAKLEAYDAEQNALALSKELENINNAFGQHSDSSNGLGTEVSINESSHEKDREEAIDEHLANVYQSLTQGNFDLESTITNDFKDIAFGTEEDGDTLSLALPNQPNQNWWLDGYFRLHLNHYLFITADFNVAVPFERDSLKPSTLSATKVASDKNDEPFTFKLIPFSQNKRVISKEVHYFDHPYMGMIVQIRRYTKPEPPQEDEQLTEQN
ncbi:MAG: peptidoglycan binding protein CsiV [Thalassotalea sp.]|nr:peptidoglycan binding protein CsiV [Thalassotalea sp.]